MGVLAIWGVGDDVGTFWTMWGQCGDDGDDMGMTGMTWGPRGPQGQHDKHVAAICNFFTCVFACVCACMHVYGDTPMSLDTHQLPCPLPRAGGAQIS